MSGLMGILDQRTPPIAWPNGCRVLVLDGGGIRGAFTAAVLTALEGTLKRKIADHFDLIVGTSTGAILALGLGVGISPARILDFYRTRGRTVFPAITTARRVRSTIRHLFRPKLSQKTLHEALHEVLGSQKLGESSVRLVIPTFDALKATACTFKTAHHPRLRHDVDLRIVDVAAAAAAAPTYYPAARFEERPGHAYFDGGVWANSPLLVGITEAVYFLGAQLSDIRMLSIGTTNVITDFLAKEHAGVIRWNRHLIDMMMVGQETAAISQAKLLLSDGCLERIDLRTPSRLVLDDARDEVVARLAGYGQSLAREAALLARVEAQFLNDTPAAAFRALHLPT